MMISLLMILSLIPTVSSDGVFGCGGFVKSEVDINFSRVMLKLYTSHGSIKYQTDCAPNTGYYLIPLYDKGDFILKAEPPKGWGFEPSSVELNVDGENDPCSKGEDINFKFTGFSITGKVVSNGQTSGPTGIKVDLLPASNVKADVLKSTQTKDGGSFVFTNIMPGDYVVMASHPKWKFSKGQVTVSVKKDNADIGSEISIAGYDVQGEVTADGQPMWNVNFVLFSKSADKPKSSYNHCQAGAPKGFHTRETKLQPICYTVSREDGTFVFPEVPSGSYFLVPFYKGEHITFDVEPGKLDFDVALGSVVLQTKFEVAGFSVSGKVLDKENGVGIPHVAILLNGKDQTVSGADGTYQLENMKKGTYRLAAKADNIDFEEMSVAISPNTPQLPDMVASGFSLCGKVNIDKVPETLGQISSQRRIMYFPEGKNSDASSMATASDGTFCSFVKPGKYIIRVHLTDAEVKSGLVLSPAERVVSITNKPVLDVVFSQFRAKVSGTVKCMEKCQAMDMVLDAVGRSDKQVRIPVRLAGNEAAFTFTNILPGKYKASIIMDLWCWKDKAVEVEVVENDLTGLEFTHTGYILKISVSHPITINFAHNKKEKSVGTFLLDKGLNRFCLAHPGLYQLTPESCHRFDKDHYSYDTSSPLTLTLTALQHLVLGSVVTEVPVSDIVLTIRSSVEDSPTTIGPLKPNSTATAAAKGTEKGKDTVTVYSFSHWARSGEKLTILAMSQDMLFYPKQVEVYVSGETCPGKAAELTGKKGVFVEGSIKPALEGVKVKITADDSSMEPVVMVTDAKGKYRHGPLHSDKTYSVEADKPGYVLTKESAKSMSFRAFKLGEISINVVGEDGQPLAGVLLSLSGEKQFRSNNVTGQDGAMTIVGLSPGQYFLRPMMKEYVFNPASQMIGVQEGTTEKISIKGSRVAFSVFGQVTSLNGEPEPGVIIEALGTGSEECQEYQEESKTETSGTYRIRGLQPGCLYNVQLKQGGEVNTHIERSAVTSKSIQIKDEDIRGVNIIAFRRMTQMDVTGNIQLKDLKFLPTLKVQLIDIAHPDTPIHTYPLSKSTFFFLPSLVIDHKNYLLSLLTSLSKREYDYKLPSVEFVGNRSHVHITFDFDPKPRLVDQDLNHGSFMLPVMVIVFAALAYNYKKVIPFTTNLIQQIQDYRLHGASGVGSPFTSSSSSSSSSPLSPAVANIATVGGEKNFGSEFLGLDSSPVRKRAKPRRV